MSDPMTESAQHTDAGVPGGTPTGTQTPAATLTQEQFNAALAAEKRKWKEQQDAATAEAARKAAEAEAAEKGQYEQLANERGARLATVEQEHSAVTERLSLYEAEMERQIKDRLKVLPEAIRDLDPGGDVVTRFAWLAKAEKLASSFAAPAPAPRGTPPGVRTTTASSAPNMDAIIAEKRARMGGL